MSSTDDDSHSISSIDGSKAKNKFVNTKAFTATKSKNIQRIDMTGNLQTTYSYYNPKTREVIERYLKAPRAFRTDTETQQDCASYASLIQDFQCTGAEAVAGGWTLSGNVTSSYDTTHGITMQVLEGTLAAIKDEFQMLQCPSCGGFKEYIYCIKRMNKEEESNTIEFVADLKCKMCKKREEARLIPKLLRSLNCKKTRSADQ